MNIPMHIWDKIFCLKSIALRSETAPIDIEPAQVNYERHETDI